MIQIVEAVIDKQGRVILKEKIKNGKVQRALLTILDDEIVENKESMISSIEIIDDDLESGSREIANLFNLPVPRSWVRSGVLAGQSPAIGFLNQCPVSRHLRRFSDRLEFAKITGD